MLNKDQEKQELNNSEVFVTELEIEELEQRLEMTCTRCCIDADIELN